MNKVSVLVTRTYHLVNGDQFGDARSSAIVFDNFEQARDFVAQQARAAKELLGADNLCHGFLGGYLQTDDPQIGIRTVMRTIRNTAAADAKFF